jgi:hypothetical protein
MSALGDILRVFTSRQRVAWHDFSHCTSVTWRDAEPIQNSDVANTQATHYRSGTLLLLGFAAAELPNGGYGNDAGVAYDNEGYASVSLIGDAEYVYRVEVMKYYPSLNYQEIIQWQVADGICAEFSANPRQGLAINRHSTGLVSDVVLYIVAHTDELGSRYGPGSTTFVFHKDKSMT